MILTPELISSAKFHINHANERQLDLRSKNITAMTNLIATMNYFQCIDLSNNLIARLENAHYLDRITTLVLSNNKIATVDKIGENLPNLTNLFLVGNRIHQQNEVNNLASCPKLTNLTLYGNPVTQSIGYRETTIAVIKSLRVLDFKKVEKKELEQSFRKLSGQ